MRCHSSQEPKSPRAQKHATATPKPKHEQHQKYYSINRIDKHGAQCACLAPTGVCLVELAALPGVRFRKPLSERCPSPLELALLDAAVTDGVERLHSTRAARALHFNCNH